MAYVQKSSYLVLECPIRFPKFCVFAAWPTYATCLRRSAGGGLLQQVKDAT